MVINIVKVVVVVCASQSDLLDQLAVLVVVVAEHGGVHREDVPTILLWHTCSTVTS